MGLGKAKGSHVAYGGVHSFIDSAWVRARQAVTAHMLQGHEVIRLPCGVTGSSQQCTWTEAPFRLERWGK